MLVQAVIAMIQSASSHSGSDNHARTMDVLTAGLQRRQARREKTFDEARATRSCGTMAVPRRRGADGIAFPRSEEHTSELQSQSNLVCRLLLEKKKKKKITVHNGRALE